MGQKGGEKSNKHERAIGNEKKKSFIEGLKNAARVERTNREEKQEARELEEGQEKKEASNKEKRRSKQ